MTAVKGLAVARVHLDDCGCHLTMNGHGRARTLKGLLWPVIRHNWSARADLLRSVSAVTFQGQAVGSIVTIVGRTPAASDIPERVYFAPSTYAEPFGPSIV